jgi:transcription elongation GreA/GreB family factor
MSDHQTDRAQDGTWIKVSGLTPEEEGFEDVFHLVPGPEVDHANHNVGTWSLLGQVLVGTKVGDEIVLNTKKGPMTLTVLKLGANRDDIL